MSCDCGPAIAGAAAFAIVMTAWVVAGFVFKMLGRR